MLWIANGTKFTFVADSLLELALVGCAIIIVAYFAYKGKSNINIHIHKEKDEDVPSDPPANLQEDDKE